MDFKREVQIRLRVESMCVLCAGPPRLCFTYVVQCRELYDALHQCSYNKGEDEFLSREEYDNYLEEREDISECTLCESMLFSDSSQSTSFNLSLPCAVFNLIEGTDVKEMEAKIQVYKQENAESIARNEAKKVGDMTLV